MGVHAPLDLNASEAANWLEVDQAYARAVPPGQPNSAIYMSLTNNDSRDHRLVGAQSEAARAVELHTHRMSGGMMRMRKVDAIDLPAGENVVLAPGGLHIMLIDLTVPIEAGDRVGLRLTLEDGSEKTLSAPVERVRAARHTPTRGD